MSESVNTYIDVECCCCCQRRVCENATLHVVLDKPVHDRSQSLTVLVILSPFLSCCAFASVHHLCRDLSVDSLLFCVFVPPYSYIYFPFYCGIYHVLPRHILTKTRSADAASDDEEQEVAAATAGDTLTAAMQADATLAEMISSSTAATALPAAGQQQQQRSRKEERQTVRQQKRQAERELKSAAKRQAVATTSVVNADHPATNAPAVSADTDVGATTDRNASVAGGGADEV